MITVIRIIKYECANEQDMRKQIVNSMQEGVHEKGPMTITIGTHFSDLPANPVLVIDNEALHDTLRAAIIKQLGE